MLFSEKRERAHRFGLALRMGIPILLLISVIIFYFFQNSKFVIDDIDIVIFTLILLVSIYFLFFLINMGQSETLMDVTTGTFNRHALLYEIKRYLVYHKNAPLALLRIENLGDISNHYGIDRGDRILQLYLHLLDEFMKLHDVKDLIVGRYHGGDFILLLPFEKERASTLMDEFIQTYKEIGGVEIEARYSLDEIYGNDEIEPVINHLYDTLYQKNGTKGNKKRIDLGKLESEIVKAVRQKDLILYYMPTLQLNSGKTDLFEVAVRLKTENSGILPPKKFIPIINRLGLEIEYDKALFISICKDAKSVDESICFSFNISPHSLRNEGFAQMIKEIVAEEGIDYSRIILELFENRAIKDIKRYKAVLEDLKDMGVKFALDNFGASNASSEYIKKLPVDMVQFDREFALSFSNPRIKALFKGYLLSSKELGVKTLMKWVDTEEALERFKKLGVDYIQGFIVADGPLSSEQIKSKYGVK